jgi:hypothetical protein
MFGVFKKITRKPHLTSPHRGGTRKNNFTLPSLIGEEPQRKFSPYKRKHHHMVLPL